jgi:hypothetical protein
MTGTAQRAVLDDDGSDGDTDEGLAIYPVCCNPCVFCLIVSSAVD